MKKQLKLINPKPPIEQYNFKSFICTIIFPIACLSLLHLILYLVGGDIQIAILKAHPTYQFSVWLPIDNYKYPTNIKTIFKIVYSTHAMGELFCPIVVAMICGRKSFFTYIKCTAICCVIGFVIFLCFPVVDYLLYPWYSGPDSMNAKPADFQYSTNNVAALPSFHCLMALCPIAAMCFVKIDQKKIKKATYIPFLVFMIVYYVLIYLSTIITKTHYVVDGWLSILIALVVFGLAAIIHRKRNGIYVANIFEKIYLFVDSKKQKHKGWRMIVMIAIFVIILVLLFAAIPILNHAIWNIIS